MRSTILRILPFAQSNFDCESNYKSFRRSQTEQNVDRRRRRRHLVHTSNIPQRAVDYAQTARPQTRPPKFPVTQRVKPVWLPCQSAQITRFAQTRDNSEPSMLCI